MTVPVKKSSCLLFLQHCYGKEINISDLETVAEMVILATRFGEDNLLSSMQDKLQCAEIGDKDNLSPLYLLIRGVGQVPVLYVNMSNCEIVQAIVCAGVDACISPLGMLGFSSARALSKQFNETPEVTIGIKRSSSYMQIRWPADPLMPSEMVL